MVRRARKRPAPLRWEEEARELSAALAHYLRKPALAPPQRLRAALRGWAESGQETPAQARGRRLAMVASLIALERTDHPEPQRHRREPAEAFRERIEDWTRKLRRALAQKIRSAPRTAEIAKMTAEQIAEVAIPALRRGTGPAPALVRVAARVYCVLSDELEVDPRGDETSSRDSRFRDLMSAQKLLQNKVLYR